MFVPNITQLHKNRVNMDITLRLNAAQYCPRVFLCINSILRITSSIFTKTVYNKITQLVMQQKRKDGSVNPFKYQSGHAVTRHTTKLETGGGQLSCQLKPCKKHSYITIITVFETLLVWEICWYVKYQVWRSGAAALWSSCRRWWWRSLLVALQFLKSSHRAFLPPLCPLGSN